MAAARFWRLTGMVPAAADGLELSGLRLRLAGADVAGTLSATIAPVDGSVAALSDGDLQTSCAFAAAAVREPGFGFVWDLGSALDVDSFRVGSAPSAASAARWLEVATLQSSATGQVWQTVLTAGRIAWPGAAAWTDSLQAYQPLRVRAVRQALSRVHPPGAVGGVSVLSMGLRVLKDMEFGGNGRIYGTTKAKGTSNVPTRSRVVLLRQRDKALARETWSDAATGAFEFRHIDTRQAWLVLAEDAAGGFRPVAASQLVAEVQA